MLKEELNTSSPQSAKNETPGKKQPLFKQNFQQGLLKWFKTEELLCSSISMGEDLRRQPFHR